jgi:hypothetical protein
VTATVQLALTAPRSRLTLLAWSTERERNAAVDAGHSGDVGGAVRVGCPLWRCSYVCASRGRPIVAVSLLTDKGLVRGSRSLGAASDLRTSMWLAEKPATLGSAIYPCSVGRRAILELRLSTLATPSRVADATRMLALAIEAGFPDASAEMSLVVENREMRVHLGAWTEKAARAATNFADFLENPTVQTLASDAMAMADAIEEYCRDAIELEPAFWKPRARKPFRVVNPEFLDHLRVVREERISVLVKPRLMGTTTIVSPVLRVGRLTTKSVRRARIQWAGKSYDVEVDESVFANFCEAAKHGRPMKIQLVAAWAQAPDGLQFSNVGTKAVHIEEPQGYAGLINSELARLPPLMTAEEASMVYAGLRRGDDDE